MAKQLLAFIFLLQLFIHAKLENVEEDYQTADPKFQVEKYTLNSISINWDEDKIKISELNISFCPVITQTVCKTFEAHSSDSSKLIEMDKLEPWTNYSIVIYGTPNQSKIYQGYIKTEPTHPTKPLELTYDWKNESSIYITWKQPEKPNGRLDGYTIQFDTSEVEVESTIMNYQFTGIPKKAEIVVRVYAFNKINDMRLDGEPAKIVIEAWKESTTASSTVTESTVMLSNGTVSFYNDTKETALSESTVTAGGLNLGAVIGGVLAFVVIFIILPVGYGKWRNKKMEKQRNGML